MCVCVCGLAQVFSQVMGYLWRLKPNVLRLVEQSPLWQQLHSNKHNNKRKRYMAFHIRVADNGFRL